MTFSRRRLALAATAGLLCGLVAGPALPAAGARPGRVDSGRAPTRTVLVQLRDPGPLAPGAGTDRAARTRAVIEGLRRHADRTQAPLRARLDALEVQGEVLAVAPLWVTNAVSVTATDRAIGELTARPDVARVTPDAIRVVRTDVAAVRPAAAPEAGGTAAATTSTTTTSTAEPGIAAVGAPALWAAGHTGQGVVVATLDTGVDVTNPDLAASWRGGANSWFDPYGQHPAAPVDLDGHGTATTGVLVGGDGAGTAYGMAPGARWIAARVFDDRGAVSATAMHRAFQWLLDPDHDPATADAPQVVNGSWVLGSGPSCDLSFQPDVRALRAAGILPVFSGGNFGPTASTSASPANYPESLSVGALDSTDAVWAYSSAGPATCGGRARVFPDLVAPGDRILAADRYGSYQWVTGTSIAAPHVAGGAALLLSSHPGLGVESQASALTSGALDLGPTGPDDRYGFGRLDVAAADALAVPNPDVTVTATPVTASTTVGSTLSFAVDARPVDGFASPLALSLQGLPANGAAWSFTPATVGPGAWSSTLLVTTAAGLAPGTYPLTVTASSGGGLTRMAGIGLTVTPAPDFTVGASPSALAIKRGRAASTAVAVGSLGGFTAAVALSVSGLPPGVTATWSANPVAAPSSSTLKLAVSGKAKAGSYRVVVTGTSAARTRTAPLSLVVR